MLLLSCAACARSSLREPFRRSQAGKFGHEIEYSRPSCCNQVENKLTAADPCVLNSGGHPGSGSEVVALIVVDQRCCDLIASVGAASDLVSMCGLRIP
eukprot:scaffold11495_cov30-Tisochrysis_lutea.AAC.2